MSASSNRATDEAAIRELVESGRERYVPRISTGFLPITLRTC